MIGGLVQPRRGASMMAFRFLQGVGTGGEVPVASAYINEFIGAEKRKISVSRRTGDHLDAALILKVTPRADDITIPPISELHKRIRVVPMPHGSQALHHELVVALKARLVFYRRINLRLAIMLELIFERFVAELLAENRSDVHSPSRFNAFIE